MKQINEELDQLKSMQTKVEALTSPVLESPSSEKEPYFQKRSGRKTSSSPVNEESKSKKNSQRATRNETSLPKQLGTIEEEETEPQATISPINTTKLNEETEEESKRSVQQPKP